MVMKDMLPALLLPSLFAAAFNLTPTAASQASAVLSDLAPQPGFDGIADPRTAFASSIPWSTFRWVPALALLASLELFVVMSGALAMGLYRYRFAIRGISSDFTARSIAWFGCAALPAVTLMHLLMLARAKGPWPGSDPFSVLVLLLLGLLAVNWWWLGRILVTFRTGIAIFLVAVPVLIVCLGTQRGTLLLFAPGTEFFVLDVLGPMVVLLVALSFAALGLGLTVSISRRRRRPIFAGMVGWIALLAWFDLNDNHPVRLQDDPRLASAVHAVRDDDSLWINDGEWPAILSPWRNAVLPDGDRRPLVLVRAEGGGIRAAYFTAATLGRIADKCPRIARNILAVSGISGGALGVAAYAMAVRAHAIPANDNRCDFSVAGRGYFEAGLSRMFRRDLLSPVVARALFPDFAQRAIPIPVTAFDRQLGLELGLRQSFAAEFNSNGFSGPMGQPEGSYEIPFIVVGATSVGTGNQKLFSEYDQVPFKGGRLQAFNLASVVATSARFPLISPPGYFYGHLGEYRAEEPITHKIQLVDGGYYDNSGAYALTEILDRISYYRHHDNGGERTDKPPLGAQTPVLWIKISNSPDCIPGYPSHYLDALCARQKDTEQHPSFGLAEILSPLKAVWGARTAKERITILATRQLLDERNELEKSRDFEIDIQMAPIEDDIPLGWYLSERSAHSLSWQLSTKSDPRCILNSDDVALASCGLERLQYLVSPQTADVKRIDVYLADFISGYDGMQRMSCEHAFHDQANAEAAIYACEQGDRLPTAYCLETPLHPSACAPGRSGSP